MKVLTLFACFFFLLICGVSAQSSESSQSSVDAQNGLNVAVPWQPLQVMIKQIPETGKIFEFHFVDRATYARHYGLLPQTYTERLKDCVDRKGDCTQNIVIVPSEH